MFHPSFQITLVLHWAILFLILLSRSIYVMASVAIFKKWKMLKTLFAVLFFFNPNIRSMSGIPTSTMKLQWKWTKNTQKYQYSYKLCHTIYWWVIGGECFVCCWLKKYLRTAYLRPINNMAGNLDLRNFLEKLSFRWFWICPFSAPWFDWPHGLMDRISIFQFVQNFPSIYPFVRKNTLINKMLKIR